MRSNPARSIILLLSTLLIGQTRSAYTNYDDVLENQLIDDQLRLLGPEGILRNRRIFHQKGHQIVNNTCARDLVLYEDAIDKRESWALKMLDASSKLPAGMLQGHVIDMGMYDECMEAHGRTTGVEIHGRHCMYAINPTLEKSFILNPTLSICLPASCDAKDVINLLQDTINATDKLKNLGINIASATCTPKAPDHMSKNFIICCVLTTAYISFLLLCTLCDLANRQIEKPSSDIVKTLARFSLLKNAEAIFSTKVHESNLPVIHGIRAISTCWIVLVHEYLVQLLGVNVNTVYITKWFSSWGSMYPLIGVLSVDTFLVLSGFLMAYNFFKKIYITEKFNIFLYYLHRFIRLTFPVVILTLSTSVTIPFLGSGARYQWLADIFVTGCDTKWWSVIFYFQNFLEANNYCLLHLWSLSVDMQLYWLSPLILYPLYKRPKTGLIILTAFMLASIIITGSIIGINKYSPIYITHDFNITILMEAFQKVYQMPHTRASPWLMGILFAYEITHQNIKPNKTLISMGWLLAIASFAFCIFGTRSFTQANYENNPIWEVTFSILQRPLWAFGVCWIIYASLHNAAGPISNILSANFFLPISRLSYSIYLVHIVLPMFQVGTSRAAKYFDQYSVMQSYVGDMVLAIAAAFGFSLVFERPVLVLEDMVFKRNKILPRKTEKTK